MTENDRTATQLAAAEAIRLALLPVLAATEGDGPQAMAAVTAAIVSAIEDIGHEIEATSVVDILAPGIGIAGGVAVGYGHLMAFQAADAGTAE